MMTCSNFPVDDYLDGELSSAQEAEFLRHLEGCGHCQARFALEKKRRVVMRTLPSPRLHPDFAARCFDNVQRQQQQRQRKWRWGMGSGVAASMLVAALLLVSAQQWQSQPLLAEESLVVLELHNSRDVQFSVTAREALNGVRLQVSLPDNVEIIGYPQMRELTWTTDLKEGANILSLPLKAAHTGSGEVVMNIHSPSGKVTRKSIRLDTIRPDTA